VFTALGTLAGPALDMTDPQTALGAILPPVFRPAFLLATILDAVASNAMTRRRAAGHAASHADRDRGPG
jgi:nucleobase:cation symporter-1, NCS1 family